MRARAARDLVATLDVAEDRIGWLHLQAEAWATLGNAHRAAGDLQRGERALTVAAAFLALVPTAEQNGRTRARLAQQAAYLRNDQTRTDEALRLNTEAVRGFENLGDRQAAATALVDRALFLHRSGSTRAAIPIVERALDVLDPALAPRAHRAALHNRAVYHLAAAGSAADVELACHHVDQAFAAHDDAAGDPFDGVRLWSAVALAALRLGPRSAALDSLRKIQQAVDDHGSATTRTFILLHRVAAAVDDGRRGEANRLAGRLYPLLRRLDLPSALRTDLVRGLASAQGLPISVEAIRRIAHRMAELAGEEPPT